ncbi:hypothetical protein C8R44DRAFT_948707 [Mycena epipterygia]|nr:hypothetical protein C8R44DRAFT_948707 [Mycena epipterygia]
MSKPKLAACCRRRRKRIQSNDNLMKAWVLWKGLRRTLLEELTGCGVNQVNDSTDLAMELGNTGRHTSDGTALRLEPSSRVLTRHRLGLISAMLGSRKVHLAPMDSLVDIYPWPSALMGKPSEIVMNSTLIIHLNSARSEHYSWRLFEEEKRVETRLGLTQGEKAPAVNIRLWQCSPASDSVHSQFQDECLTPPPPVTLSAFTGTLSPTAASNSPPPAAPRRKWSSGTSVVGQEERPRTRSSSANTAKTTPSASPSSSVPSLSAPSCAPSSMVSGPSSADSPALAGNWKALAPAERAKWEALAKEKKHEHEMLHPNYVYRPRRSSTKNRTSSSSSHPSSAAAPSSTAPRRKHSAPSPQPQVKFVMPAPRPRGGAGRSSSAPTPPPYQAIRIPNVYFGGASANSFATSSSPSFTTDSSPSFAADGSSFASNGSHGFDSNGFDANGFSTDANAFSNGDRGSASPASLMPMISRRGRSGGFDYMPSFAGAFDFEASLQVHLKIHGDACFRKVAAFLRGLEEDQGLWAAQCDDFLKYTHEIDEFLLEGHNTSRSSEGLAQNERQSSKEPDGTLRKLKRITNEAAIYAVGGSELANAGTGMSQAVRAGGGSPKSEYQGATSRRTRGAEDEVILRHKYRKIPASQNDEQRSERSVQSGEEFNQSQSRDPARIYLIPSVIGNVRLGVDPTRSPK